MVPRVSTRDIDSPSTDPRADLILRGFVKRPLLVLVLVSAAAACAGGDSGSSTSGETPTPTVEESPTPTPTPIVTPPLHPTVEEAVDDGCATSIVRPLSEQLIAELNCISPGAVSEIPSDPQINVGNIFDFLQTPPGTSLPVVVDDRPGVTMTINSALRSLAQQYLLYEWYQSNTCGISLAASPGTSNHERGLAIDINDSAGWRDELQAHSWTWIGSSDPVHYDYTGGGTVNIQGSSVRAFQRLWNLNRPDDEIDVDGIYGPQTEARLAQSPVAGFGIDSTCGNTAVAMVPFRFVLDEAPEICGL